MGICLTQAVHTSTINLIKDGEEIPAAFHKYWGSLVKSVWSLFQAITGGVDWDDVCRPLIEHIGPELGFLFCIYILFSELAMLNVVTGVFIEAVMANDAKEKELHKIIQVQ